MKINVLWIGKTRNKEMASLIENYSRRIASLCPLKIVEIHEEKNLAKLPKKEALKREGKKIFKKMGKRGAFIVLHDRGTPLTSEELARKISTWSQSHREMTFIVGSHYGLDSPVKENALFSLSLSKLTFTHDMARVILLEQIYRALTIIKKIPYHKS